MIATYAAAICMAFSLTVALTPFVRQLAFKIGAVDIPDHKRKTHSKPMPALGGIAVAFGFLMTLWFVRLLFPDLEFVAVWTLVLPGAAILLVGVLDDTWGLKPRYKLLLQFLAALVFYWCGLRMEKVFGINLPVWVALPATLLWLVACANVVNLLDGMDGLAAGIGALVCGTLLALSAYVGEAALAVLFGSFFGACVGFLLFNFPPAVIFLGDTGSLFLGMMLGALALEGSFKSHLAFALLVPLLALGLPIMDTLLAIIRRVNRRASIFSADKEHMHHRLVALGFTRRQALILLYGVTVILASVALLIAFMGNLISGFLIVAGGVILVLVVRFLGAPEFRAFTFIILRALGLRNAESSNTPQTQPKSPAGAARPRVAFLTPLPTPYRQPLLEQLAARDDFDLTVYYLADREGDRSWKVPVPENDPRFRILPGRSFGRVAKKSFFNHWNPSLLRQLSEARYDLVVVPGYALLSAQATIGWSWLNGTPYVIHSESHHAEPRHAFRRGVKQLVLDRVIGRAAACLATGTLSREYLCSYGADPDRVFFFPNTPDVEWFTQQSNRLRPKRAELRRKWDMPEGPVVLFVGRLLQVKGVDVLLRAFATIVNEHADAHLLIVGDGPERQALEKQAGELEIGERVHFMGFHQRDTLVELYACADVFCLPSRHEPWGAVVNEAAACGLPLIVSDRVGAGADLVEPNVNGAIVPVEDAPALADAISHCIAMRNDSDPVAARSRELAAAWGYPLAIEQFASMVRLICPPAGDAG